MGNTKKAVETVKKGGIKALSGGKGAANTPKSPRKKSAGRSSVAGGPFGIFSLKFSKGGIVQKPK